MHRVSPKKETSLSILGRFSFHIVFVLLIANIGMVIAIRLYILAQLPCFTSEQVQADTRCLYILNGKVYEKGSRSNPHHGHACGSDVTAAIVTQPFHLADAAKYLDPNLKGQICAANPTPTPTPTPTPNPTPSPTPLATASPLINPTPSTQINPTPTPTPTPSSRTNIQPTATPGIGGFVNPSPSPTPSKSVPSASPKSTPHPTPQNLAGASAQPIESPVVNTIVQTPIVSPNTTVPSPSPPDTEKDWTETVVSLTQAAIYVALGVLAFTVTVGTGRYFQHKKDKSAKNS